MIPLYHTRLHLNTLEQEIIFAGLIKCAGMLKKATWQGTERDLQDPRTASRGQLAKTWGLLSSSCKETNPTNNLNDPGEVFL